MKILILDDNCDFCEIVKDELSFSGFKDITICNSYKEAMSKISINYDLVLIDMVLFGESKTGLDFAILYKEAHQNTKFILITVHNHDELKNLLSKHTNLFNASFIKPFDIKSLCKKSKELLGIKMDTLNIVDRIEDVEIKIQNIESDLDCIKEDQSEYRNRLEFTCSKIIEIEKSMSNTEKVSTSTQEIVMKFVAAHADDGYKIIGTISAIVTILLTIVTTILYIVLK